MKKPRELKVRCYMHILATDNTVTFEELTPEEREYCAEQMRERLSRNMSDYYAQHPEAYALLKDLSEASKSGGQTA